MSDKKLYYQFSDNADVSEVVMELSGIMEWIKQDEYEANEVDDEREYTIKPVYMTEEEYNNLPEADI